MKTYIVYNPGKSEVPPCIVQTDCVSESVAQYYYELPDGYKDWHVISASMSARGEPSYTRVSFIVVSPSGVKEKLSFPCRSIQMEKGTYIQHTPNYPTRVVEYDGNFCSTSDGSTRFTPRVPENYTRIPDDYIQGSWSIDISSDGQHWILTTRHLTYAGGVGRSWTATPNTGGRYQDVRNGNDGIKGKPVSAFAEVDLRKMRRSTLIHSVKIEV